MKHPLVYYVCLASGTVLWLVCVATLAHMGVNYLRPVEVKKPTAGGYDYIWTTDPDQCATLGGRVPSAVLLELNPLGNIRWPPGTKWYVCTRPK